MKFKEAINKLRPKIDDDFRDEMQFFFWLTAGFSILTVIVTLVWQLWGGFGTAVMIYVAIGLIGFGTRGNAA